MNKIKINMFTKFLKFIFKISIFIIVVQILILSLEHEWVFYILFFLVLYVWLSVVHRIEEGPRMYKCFKFINGFFLKLTKVVTKVVLFSILYFNITMSYLNFIYFLSDNYVLVGDLMVFIEYNQIMYEIFFCLVCYMSLCMTFHICASNHFVYKCLRKINLFSYHVLRFLIIFVFFMHNILFFIEEPCTYFDSFDRIFRIIRSRTYLYQWLYYLVYYTSMRFTFHIDRSHFPKLNKLTALLSKIIIKLIKFLLVWLLIAYIIFCLMLSLFLHKLHNVLLFMTAHNPPFDHIVYDPFFDRIFYFVAIVSMCCTIRVRAKSHLYTYKCFLVVYHAILKLFKFVALLLFVAYNVYYFELIHHFIDVPPHIIDYYTGFSNSKHCSDTAIGIFSLISHYLVSGDLHGSSNTLDVFNSELYFMFGKDCIHNSSHRTMEVFKLEAYDFITKDLHGSFASIEVLKNEAYGFVTRNLHGSVGSIEVFTLEATREWLYYCMLIMLIC